MKPAIENQKGRVLEIFSAFRWAMAALVGTWMQSQQRVEPDPTSIPSETPRRLVGYPT